VAICGEINQIHSPDSARRGIAVQEVKNRKGRVRTTLTAEGEGTIEVRKK
jgi:hypothetical protein